MKQYRKGFTLTELLAVIGIVSLLAIVLYPLLYRRPTPHRSNCQSNLKQIGLGLAQYTQDYNEIMPLSGTASAVNDTGWVRQLQPYLKSMQLFRCPVVDASEMDDKAGSPRTTSFYFNSQLARTALKQIDNPAVTISLGEGEIASSNYACSSLDICSGFNTDGIVGAVPESARKRHMDGSNYGFADGHVKWFRHDTSIGGPVKNARLTFNVR